MSSKGLRRLRKEGQAILGGFYLLRKAQASRSAVGQNKAGDSETDFFFLSQKVNQGRC